MAEGKEESYSQEDAPKDELLPTRQPRPMEVRQMERPEAASGLVARRLTAGHSEPF